MFWAAPCCWGGRLVSLPPALWEVNAEEYISLIVLCFVGYRRGWEVGGQVGEVHGRLNQRHSRVAERT
jgi:hypothetical protein